MNMRKLTRDDVTFTLSVEFEDDVPVRGSFASGDDAADEQLVQEILARLDRGEVWAWACVTVQATWEGISAGASLGACSYANEKDFKTEGGYYEDMCGEALDDLNATLAAMHQKLSKLG